MPRDCNSSAMPRTVVIPERLMSSTMPRRSAACWAALALMDATASVLPTCLPWSARAPLGLPSFTPRTFGAAIALLVRTDQARLQLRYSGHLRKQEPSHRSSGDIGKVAEDKVHVARHEGP